ncbi:MAG TPA: ribosomal protein S18-alanine N-acetyltransferase [Candidatus Eremiobacteraeota bacterium]|nr:ribosomal protein S18-alanine N-acetyltransferase [Candidatus Eremiobacteraeota bacterium]
MDNSHLDEVMELEKKTFPDSLWPASLFFCEVNLNPAGIYFVALKNDRVIGYAGMWLRLRQSHITTLVVDKDYRKKGVALSLIVKLLREAIKRKASHAVLEVKRSNKAAINLYKKLNFKLIGMRKNYYVEDKEDGIVMFLENLKGSKVKEMLDRFDKRHV